MSQFDLWTALAAARFRGIGLLGPRVPHGLVLSNVSHAPPAGGAGAANRRRIALTVPLPKVVAVGQTGSQ